MGTHIANGVIQGFTFGGINCPTYCVIDNVRAWQNEGAGFNVGQGSVVRNSDALLNLGEGVSVGRG